MASHGLRHRAIAIRIGMPLGSLGWAQKIFFRAPAEFPRPGRGPRFGTCARAHAEDYKEPRPVIDTLSEETFSSSESVSITGRVRSHISKFYLSSRDHVITSIDIDIDIDKLMHPDLVRVLVWTDRKRNMNR